MLYLTSNGCLMLLKIVSPEINFSRISSFHLNRKHTMCPLYPNVVNTNANTTGKSACMHIAHTQVHTHTHCRNSISRAHIHVCAHFARACLYNILPVSPSATACVSLPPLLPPPLLSPKRVCLYYVFLSPCVSKQYNVVCLESVSDRHAFKLPYCYVTFADMIIGEN